MERKFNKRGMKVLGITLLIYAILVAPHEGEFWPFSIYPMFSQAGNPWTRAMVLDVTDKSEQERWNDHLLQDRVSDAVPVGSYGVDQIDFSNFVVKTENWTESRRNALIAMFGSENIEGRKWMVSKVRGEMVEQDSVAIEIRPFIMITADTTYLNPNLFDEAYRGGAE